MQILRKILKKTKTPGAIGICVLILTISIIIISSTILYNRTVNLLTDNLRERILTISISTAANIDAEDLAALQQEADWQKPEWAEIVNSLHRVKYDNRDIVFMYIFRKTANDPAEMEFVVDADSLDPYANTGSDTSKYVDVNRDGKIEPDGPDKLQWPGQPYPEAVDIPEAFAAYDGPLTSADLYTDEYGSVITGYAPIRDKNGNTVAVLATDVKADDFFTLTTQTLRPFLIFIIFLTIIISILTIVLIYAWRRYAGLLERYNQNQQSLLHFITHQVKGVLTKSRNIFDGILLGEYGEVNDKVKIMAKYGFDSDTKGVETVQSILKASDLKSGKTVFEKKKINLSKLIAEIVEKGKLAAQRKNLELSFDIEPNILIEVDPLKISEVFQNLIDNAITYTSAGEVKVVLKASKNNVKFSVIDTGFGLSHEDLKHLFTEGGKGRDSLSVNVDSTGYGLFVAKKIVDEHDGRIGAKSEGRSKGSEFFVILPQIQ